MITLNEWQFLGVFLFAMFCGAAMTLVLAAATARMGDPDDASAP